MASRLPLPALLSFALVAFTIEFDNEAEHRLPHRTTRNGAGGGSGPWLISMAMWVNCLRWVPEEGIAVRELERLARTRTNWDGMRRWGYIWFEPDPRDRRPKPPASALIVRATVEGRLAQAILAPLIGEIEDRWRQRFGAELVAKMRRALVALVEQLDPHLPDCMPILKFGLATEGPDAVQSASVTSEPFDRLPLPALIARILVGFAVEFEQESSVSLAICADVLRVIGDQGTAVRELPEFGGISKEAAAMAVSFLTKRGFANVQADPRGTRAKILLLTPQGMEAREKYLRLVPALEQRWAERCGKQNVEALMAALDTIAADGTAASSPLFSGLEPYPEGWRARMRKLETLPHYPMVLHRGGYPDGS